ncbi:ULP_PROTEASE domain-containing protein [Raphanus sativus]|nr:ULP_PROTEASE domain-containing protein [Raphanus sativus]
MSIPAAVRDPPSPQDMQGDNQPDHLLPPRLFATDRFPIGRLNIYSKPDLLAFIRHVLGDSDEFKYIKNSSFGQLFDLPARQCPVSCKLIHSMLTRQLTTEDKLTLWSVFGGNPIKFGLQEFGTITGLPCGAFPVGYTTAIEDQSQAHKDSYWIELFGKKKFITIADVRRKLESDSDMHGWKKLRLALIIIVDGVLIAHQQTPRPTLKYVRMVKDVDTFCSHPWGRESFLKTISCMKPPPFDPVKCKDPIDTLVQFLRQETLRLRGFPLALQLLAYQAVPKLQATIPIPYDELSIMDLGEPHLPVYPAPSIHDILTVEWDPDLEVTSLIPIHSKPEHGWGVWPDVSNDERVAYMEQLIADHIPFKKHLWHGGDTSEPFITPESEEDGPIIDVDPGEPKVVFKRNNKLRPPPKEALKPKKSAKRPPPKETARKQRRISRYFQAASSSSGDNERILELLTAITTQLSTMQKEHKEFRQLIKRKRNPICHKRSGFNTLHRRSKKPVKVNRGCQSEPTPNSAPQTEPMEEDPIVSQYEKEVHRSTSITKSTNGFTTDPPLADHVHPTQFETLPVHVSSEHVSQDPIVSQYEAELHRSASLTQSTNGITKDQPPADPVHDTQFETLHVHVSSEHGTPGHILAEHTSPVHTPDIDVSLQNNDPPEVTTPTSLRTPSVIYDTSAHPYSHPFEPISQDSPSLTQPRYDSSIKPSSIRQIFPLSPLYLSTDTSLNKSSDSLLGFVAHATTANAFHATAIANNLPVTNETKLKEQTAYDSDFVELSDGSPARARSKHILTQEEVDLQELHCCKDVPAFDLISPLPQTQWDSFEKTVTKIKDV